MILDYTMESNDSIKASTPTDRELNLKFNYDNMHVDAKMDSFSTVDDTQVHLDKFYYRWDNLIFLDFKFYVDDFLFKEEFLWSRENKEVADIKRFCINLLTESIFTPEGNLKEGLGPFTVDYLELCSEYMTKRILEEVQLYEKHQPFKLIRSGIFGSGCGIRDEHLVTVSIDFGNLVDKFEWNIIDENNIPEEFALKMSCDLGLSDEDRNRITMTIRRTIRDYVFDRLGNFLRVLTRDKDTHGKEDVLKEDTRLKIKFPYVFDSNFEQQLGKKTYRQGKTSRKLKEIKSLPTSFEFKEHKEDSYVETRRKVKNTNEDKNRSAFGLLDNMTNKKILFYNPSKILISKKILKYTPSDKVVIMKSDIEPYMKQNEEDKAGHKEECSENTNDHNEQNEQGLIPNGRHTPERSYPNSKEECNDMELNEDVEVKIEDL